MKKKKQLTSEQLYKANRRKSKTFNRLSPVVFWLFIALTVIFICLTIQNSIGNVVEIVSLLDKDTHTGEEIAKNYALLIEKYGEWVVVGADGGVVAIKFVDVRKALFSGLAFTYGIITIVCFICAVVGKFLFKRLSKSYSESNDVMVDIATLKTLDKVEKAQEKKEEFF